MIIISRTFLGTSYIFYYIVTFLLSIPSLHVIRIMTVKDINNGGWVFWSVYRVYPWNLKDENRANDIVRTHMKSYGPCCWNRNILCKAWLFTTAYHNMIDIIRRERKITALEPSHELNMIYESHYSDLNEYFMSLWKDFRTAKKRCTSKRLWRIQL